MISIIIPVYDPGAYLEECLASLDEQTSQGFEVVLVDDGSTDGSADVCDAYCDQHERAFVLHTANAGPDAARRKGLEQARGELTIFMDADDCLRRDAIEMLQKAFDATGADILAFGYCYGTKPAFMRNDMRVDGLEEGFYSGSRYGAVQRVLCAGQFNSLWTKAVRTELLAQAFGDADAPVSFGEDLYRCIDIIEQARSLHYLDQPLYFYRRNQGGNALNFRPQQIEDLTLVLEKLGSHARRWGAGCERACNRAVLHNAFMPIMFVSASHESKGEKKIRYAKIREMIDSCCKGTVDEIASTFPLHSALLVRCLWHGWYDLTEALGKLDYVAYKIKERCGR